VSEEEAEGVDGLDLIGMNPVEEGRVTGPAPAPPTVALLSLSMGSGESASGEGFEVLGGRRAPFPWDSSSDPCPCDGGDLMLLPLLSNGIYHTSTQVQIIPN